MHAQTVMAQENAEELDALFLFHKPKDNKATQHLYVANWVGDAATAHKVFSKYGQMLQVLLSQQKPIVFVSKMQMCICNDKAQDFPITMRFTIRLCSKARQVLHQRCTRYTIQFAKKQVDESCLSRFVIISHR